MSELIDSIFDVAKISKEVSDISANLEGLKSTISTFSADVKKAMDSTRSAKNGDDLSKSAKQINDAMTGGSKAAKEYQTELEKLKAKTEQLTGAEKNANIEIAKARLELAAAQKEIKATAAAEIEAAAATNKVADSYSALQKDLKDAQLAYKEMSKAERESASGKALLKKISETQNELKDLDKGMGVFNRNVGNYVGAIESMLPKIGGLGGAALSAGQAAFSGQDGFKALGKTIVETGKAMLTNPFVLIGAAIIGLIKGIKDAIGESEERTNAISITFAQFKPILRTIGDGFEFLADAVIKTVGFLGKAFSAVTEFLGINPKGSSDAFVSAEKSKQAAILETRKLNEQAAEQEAIIAEQREILADKENYSYSQRTEALKKAGEAEKQLSSDRQRIAELNLKALQEEAALDDNNAEMNNKISAAIVAVSNAKKESADVGRKLAKEQQKLTRENQADLKAEADAAKEAAEKKAEAAKEAAKQIQDAQRRLTDSQIALMAEGEAKQIAISDESFKRQLEDLKANGQLTTELQKNLETAHGTEIQKIKDDFAKQAEEKQKADFNKQLADIEKNMAKEVAIIGAAYKEKETELKKQFASGKINRKKYESDLLKLQDEAAKDANNKSIETLQKQLEIANISADKKAEISNKIRDLQIENENLVLDATIKANEKKIKSDKDGFDKRFKIAQQLAGTAMELFSAIDDFQKQESEKRIQELEAEQTKNDENFTKQQENLDKSIMSDANRAEVQKKIDEEKARRDKEIADKVKAEKIKQAKWDKAQALINAAINTAMAVVGMLANPGGVLGGILAIAAGITGAAQIATIASQQIPAFAKGGTTGTGLALWGEVQPEVAVTKTGQIMYAENPTISNFDAGTRIYKSVEEFERNVTATNQEKFNFDYEKFGEQMPKISVNLDSSGLWGIVNKQNDRAVMINRRYKIGN